MSISELLTLAATATPSPTPGVTAEKAGPGVLGFIVTAAMVVAVIFLLVNMSRRIRRVRYREQVREEFEGRAAGESEPRGSADVDR